MIFGPFHVLGEYRIFRTVCRISCTTPSPRPGRGVRSLNKQNRESALPRGGTGGPEQGTGGPEQGTGGPEQGTGGPEQWTRGPERARTLRSLNKQNRESALPRGGTGGPEQGTGGPEQGTGGPERARTLRAPYMLCFAAHPLAPSDSQDTGHTLGCDRNFRCPLQIAKHQRRYRRPGNVISPLFR